MVKLNIQSKGMRNILEIEVGANQLGVVFFTVRAIDPLGSFAEETFVVEVNPVNDLPVVAVPIPDLTIRDGRSRAPNFVDLNLIFDDTTFQMAN